MKKVIPFTIVALLLFSFIFYNQYSKNEIKSEKEKYSISGAYEALKFNADRQAYPADNIPNGAYYRAWEKYKNNGASARENDPLPYESMGPHNRGGRTLAMAFNPQNANTFYVGSASGGLWRSYSTGEGVAAWEQVDIEFPVLGVSSITFAPEDSMTMYIGTGEVYNYFEAGTGAAYRSTRGSWGIGILKSTDGGETWSKSLDWSYNENHGVWAIKVDQNNANLVYAATTEGVYKSTDAGATWDQVLDVVMATDLVIKPSDANQVVVTCGNLGSSNYGVYKTMDGGTSWEKIENGLPTTYLGKGQLALAPSDENILYASIGNGFGFDDGASWLCRSEDFGTTWEIRSTQDYSQWQGWFAHDVAVSPTNPDLLIIIGIEVWRSTNGGQSMNLVSVGGVGDANPPIEGPDGNSSYVHSDAHDVIFHPENSTTVYVASDGGIHRSEDIGNTWHSANGAYQTAQFYNGTSTSSVDEDFFIGGLQDNGTIKWNGDLTWTRKFGGDGSWTASTSDSDTYFVSYQRLNVQKTTNDNNFSGLFLGDLSNSEAAFIAPYVVAPNNEQLMYAGATLIGKSTNGGNFWVTLNNGNVLDGNPALSMEVSPENEEVVYVATAPGQFGRGHVFVTVDGDIFTDITQDLPDRYPMDMTVDPTDEATAYITFAGFGSGHVYKTTDYGTSWEDISGDLPDVPTNAVIVDPLYPDNIYVGNDFGVFLSDDGGLNWRPYVDGMPGISMVFDLKISPTNRKLRVATHGNGAYERDLAEDFVANENIYTNLNIKVYPNPSNGPITLSFNNPESEKLVIELIDPTGRFIRTLSKETYSEGLQKIQFDISDLPKGIYYLRLKNEKQSILRKVVLS